MAQAALYTLVCLLACASASAQDVQTSSDETGGRVDPEARTETVLLTSAEFRLHLGSEDSPWEARTAVYYQRDENLSRFGGHYVLGEVLYHFEQWGTLSAQVLSLDLAEGRDASLVRLEWQRVWLGPRLVPLLRATAERLSVEEGVAEDNLLTNYRYRLRAGILPALNDRLRAIAMLETFPHQRFGAFREHRAYGGLQVKLAEHVDLNLVYTARHRDFGPIRWQHTAFAGVVYEGVIAGKQEPRVSPSD